MTDDSQPSKRETTVDSSGLKASRRSLLQVIGSGSVISGVSVVGKAAGPNTVKIPTIMDKIGENVLKWEEVPKSWWAHVQHVREANRDAQDMLIDRDGVLSVGYGKGDQTIEGKYAFQIHVGVDPNKPRPPIPDEVDGVDVHVREKEVEPLAESDGYCSNLRRFDPAPGGVTIEDEACGWGGSSAFKVVSGNGRAGMLTANHLWYCDTAAKGAAAYQCCDYVGDMGQSDPSADFAVVRGDGPFNDQIREEDGTSWDISGYYGPDGIDNLIADVEVVYRTGIGYGTDDGPVRENGVLGDYNCFNFDGYGVRTEIDAAEGDSGGPSYNIETFNSSQSAVIINHACAGVPTTEWTKITCGDNDDCDFPTRDLRVYYEFEGTAFHYLRDNFGITIY